MAMIESIHRIALKADTTDAFDLGEYMQAEMERIRSATEPPLRAYGRMIQRMEYFNPRLADYIICNVPITHLLEAEVIYRRENWKNLQFQISGETGSGKSLGAITLAKKIDFNGWNTRKLFFDDDKMKLFIQSDEIKPGDCLLKDEDLRRFGVGSVFASKTRENIEGTVRYEQINFGFVYTIERSHIVHMVLESRAEHIPVPPIADYFVFTVTVPVSSVPTQIGNVTIDVPDQETIRRYHKCKEKFIKEIEATGGAGEIISVEQASVWVKKALKKDKIFPRLQTGGARVTYVSRQFGIPKDYAKTLLEIAEMS